MALNLLFGSSVVRTLFAMIGCRRVLCKVYSSSLTSSAMSVVMIQLLDIVISAGFCREISTRRVALMILRYFFVWIF